MTVIYFVEFSTIVQVVPGFRGTLAYGITSTGELVDKPADRAHTVAVLLVDDLAQVDSNFSVAMEVEDPVVAVLHRPDVDWQTAWLERLGATTSGVGLSHTRGTPAYEEVIELLTCMTTSGRAKICERVLDGYSVQSLLISLEELAAWRALPGLTGLDRDQAEAIYAGIRYGGLPQAAESSLRRQEQPRKGEFKILEDLTVEDIEAAASALRL